MNVQVPFERAEPECIGVVSRGIDITNGGSRDVQESPPFGVHPGRSRASDPCGRSGEHTSRSGPNGLLCVKAVTPSRELLDPGTEFPYSSRSSRPVGIHETGASSEARFCSVLWSRCSAPPKSVVPLRVAQSCPGACRPLAFEPTWSSFRVFRLTFERLLAPGRPLGVHFHRLFGSPRDHTRCPTRTVLIRQLGGGA